MCGSGNGVVEAFDTQSGKILQFSTEIAVYLENGTRFPTIISILSELPIFGGPVARDRFHCHCHT